MMSDLIGEVNSWDEAFEVAVNLVKDKELDSIAFLLEEELESGKWFATDLKQPIHGWDPFKTLNDLKMIAPQMFGSPTRLLNITLPMTKHEQETKVLAIIYSKP